MTRANTGQTLTIEPGRSTRIASWQGDDDLPLRAQAWIDWSGMLRAGLNQSIWSAYQDTPLYYRVGYVQGKSAQVEHATYPYLVGLGAPFNQLQHSAAPAYGARRDFTARHAWLDLLLHPSAPGNLIVSGSIATPPAVDDSPVTERLISGISSLILPPFCTRFRVSFDSGNELVTFSQPDNATVVRTYTSTAVADWTPLPWPAAYVVQDVTSFGAGDLVTIEME